MLNLMSLRQYAKHRNVALHAVQKAISTGRIKTVIDGQGQKKIDHLVADRDWVANTDPALARSKIPEYNESRAIHEAYAARLAKLEYEERSGKLISVEETRTVWLKIITTAKTKLLAVPSKARSRLPHLLLDDIAILEELIREALEDLANGTSKDTAHDLN